MPLDKKHPPEFYPPEFRAALMAPIGSSVICAETTKQACKREARRFRAFIASCQDYPLSPEYKRLLFNVARTRVLEQPSGLFSCFVFVKEKLRLNDRINKAIGL